MWPATIQLDTATCRLSLFMLTLSVLPFESIFVIRLGRQSLIFLPFIVRVTLFVCAFWLVLFDRLVFFSSSPCLCNTLSFIIK